MISRKRWRAIKNSESAEMEAGLSWALGRSAVRRWTAHMRRVAGLLVLTGVVWAGLGSSAPDGLMRRQQLINGTVAGYGFDLVRWEAEQVVAKLQAEVAGYAAGLSDAAQNAQVRAYIAQTGQIRELERSLNRLLSENQNRLIPAAEELQRELDKLHWLQESQRPLVEQIIQNQVAAELARQGFAVNRWVFPPLQFTFTDPPKILIVSPRERIATVYSRMLSPEIGLNVIQQSEETIYTDAQMSAYITGIGGMGSFPVTMVVNSSDLYWLLSTVAHEWVHTYLWFFPLGWSFVTSNQAQAINETVAEIVGVEVGEQVLRHFYPDLVPLPSPVRPEQPTAGPPPFDHRAEMRETRLEVDRLLAEGKVAQAEAYMESRRRYMVAHGAYLRVLNQAYFAFHGNYGTSEASSGPTGPNLLRLRELMPDLRTFLVTMRSITTDAQVEAALARWEAAAVEVGKAH